MATKRPPTCSYKHWALDAVHMIAPSKRAKQHPALEEWLHSEATITAALQAGSKR